MKTDAQLYYERYSSNYADLHYRIFKSLHDQTIKIEMSNLFNEAVLVFADKSELIYCHENIPTFIYR